MCLNIMVKQPEPSPHVYLTIILSIPNSVPSPILASCSSIGDSQISHLVAENQAIWKSMITLAIAQREMMNTIPMFMHFFAVSFQDNFKKTFQCPSHFKCTGSYCIPIRHMCDAIQDCPYGEDETHCSQHNCSGFFLCILEFLHLYIPGHAVRLQ